MHEPTSDDPIVIEDDDDVPQAQEAEGDKQPKKRTDSDAVPKTKSNSKRKQPEGEGDSKNPKRMTTYNVGYTQLWMIWLSNDDTYWVELWNIHVFPCSPYFEPGCPY